MAHKRLVLWVGAAAVLSALLAWAFAPRPIEVEVVQARLGPFEASIDEDGRTRVTDRFVLSAPLAGRLRRVTLREGDAVAVGQVVATMLPVLSPMLDERTLAELRARVGAAAAGVQRAHAGVESAQVALQQAADELRRSEGLAQQGFIAATKLEADRLAAQSARRQLDAAVQGEHVAGHELDQARAALGAVQAGGTAGAAGAGFELRSPVAGQVLKLHAQSEAVLTLGAPVMDLGDVARLEVVVELLSSDALQAAPGSAVRIERWGGPGVLQGRVRRVEPVAFTKVSALGVEEQRVNVIVELTSPRTQWAALGDGYRVAVRIVTLSQREALTVPVSAVFPLPEGSADAAPAPSAPRHAVFRLEGGRARLQPVALRARNGSQAWVAQGLSAGEHVIVYPPAGVADGARVRARP